VGIQASFDWLPANGIGNIKRRGDKLIRLAKSRIKGNGCVAVIIDRDGKDIARDEPHCTIHRQCTKANIPLVAAREAMEAWFLADPKICAWLGLSIRLNTETLKDPKRVVATAFFKKIGRPYASRKTRLEIARHCGGVDDTRNASLAAATRQLLQCLQPSAETGDIA
jgi:hypothetical protein